MSGEHHPLAHVLVVARRWTGLAMGTVLTLYDALLCPRYFFGTRFVSPFSSSVASVTIPPALPNTSSSALGRLAPAASTSNRATPSPATETASYSAALSEAGSEPSATSPPVTSSHSNSAPVIEEQVVARVSLHVLREERAFHIAKSLTNTADPNGEHFIKPLDHLRLSPLPGDRGPICVSIAQYPGPNAMFKYLDCGPAFYWARKHEDKWEVRREGNRATDPPISVERFLDFAIGAAQCLEMIHHGQGIVHGEIRGDAFHYNLETSQVKLLSFGSGLRSFEHGLTSTGWTSLSRELGAKNKLLYISPEQTGRMPAEPDTRTDIYSLGVLFWTLLTRQPVFDGESPLDIVQAVLGRKIPNVSSIRLDVPDAIGRIIQKCTAKSVGDRYHSASGLRHDLVKVQKLMMDGDVDALKNWQVATKDVSSFFMLPTMMIGRAKERAELVKAIERVAKSHVMAKKGAATRFTDGSGLSNDLLDPGEGSSDGASSADGTNRRSGSVTQGASLDPRKRSSPYSYPYLASETGTVSGETMSSAQSNASGRTAKPWERNQTISFDTRSLLEGASGGELIRNGVNGEASSLSRQLGAAKYRMRGHCEIVIIEGTGGQGKSFLVQSVLAEVRRTGYCATAKFDTARRTAFGPLLKLLSALFRQVWGERNTETPFHQALKHYVRPVWPMLHKVLGLPEFLLGPVDTSFVAQSISNLQASAPTNKHIRAGPKRRGSSPEPPGTPTSSRPSKAASKTSQDFLRAGASTKTMRLINTFLDVLRLFSHYKFICFCLDDLHFADDESQDLITQIIAARLKMVMIITYRPEELSPEKVQKIIAPPELEDLPRWRAPSVTRIKLEALGEDEIVQFVASTLCRPKEDVVPLALVIQSKTAGWVDTGFGGREHLLTQAV